MNSKVPILSDWNVKRPFLTGRYLYEGSEESSNTSNGAIYNPTNLREEDFLQDLLFTFMVCYFEKKKQLF